MLYGIVELYTSTQLWLQIIIDLIMVWVSTYLGTGTVLFLLTGFSLFCLRVCVFYLRAFFVFVDIFVYFE